MKKIIKLIAKEYNVNTKALKRFVKETGVKPNQATRLEVLEILYINCSDLFYSREVRDKGTVEYLDINLLKKLIYEMNSLRDNKVYEEVEL